MTPSVIIVLPLEGSPRIVCDSLTDSEGARLVDWLEARPEYRELVKRALVLAEEAKAA